MAGAAPKRENVYPDEVLPGPRTPTNRFLTPSDRDFARLMRTAYRANVVDGKETKTEAEHALWRECFAKMERIGMFMVDVTQPFGLGTKLGRFIHPAHRG